MAKTITLNDDQIQVLRDLADYLNEGDFAQMYGVSEDEAPPESFKPMQGAPL